jgi:hypothetical protein
MKRFGIMMRRHRWAVLAALALLVIAGTAAIFSGAIFNYRTANPANTFTAGVLEHTNDGSGLATLTVDLMKPGDSRTGTVVIENTGNLEGDFSVTGTVVSSLSGADNSENALYTGKLEDVLTLTITDSGGTEVYSGAPGAFGPVDLGTWAPGDSETYTFEIEWADDPVSTPGSNFEDDNLYKGASLTMSFDWYEVQT